MTTQYTVTSHDGPFTIDSDTLDISNTALALPGRDWSGWGEFYSNNFMHLLENFAIGEPAIKRTGQLWYDVSSKTLKVWNKTDNAWSSTSKLSTAININITGDVTGSGTYNGTTNTSIAVSLPDILPAGTYDLSRFYTSPAIRVDSKGRITSISNSGGDGVGPANYVESYTVLANSKDDTSGLPNVQHSGNIFLRGGDIISALGYTPTNNGLTSINYFDIITALGFTPVSNSAALLLSGGTMAGDISMGNTRRILNLPSPLSTTSTEAAPVNYVTDELKKKTQRVFNNTGETTYNVTVSSSPPTGGNDGDVWYRY